VPRYSAGLSGSLESRSINSTILSGLPEVGVPWCLSLSIHEYLFRLCRMTGSYVGRLGTKIAFLRSACLGASVLQYLVTFSALPT
jgi:hypothetical protein